jgi:hypothetical protein
MQGDAPRFALPLFSLLYYKQYYLKQYILANIIIVLLFPFAAICRSTGRKEAIIYDLQF